MNFSALMTVRSLYVILNRFSHLSRSFNSHIAVRLLSYVRSSDADWKSSPLTSVCSSLSTSALSVRSTPKECSRTTYTSSPHSRQVEKWIRGTEVIESNSILGMFRDTPFLPGLPARRGCGCFLPFAAPGEKLPDVTIGSLRNRVLDHAAIEHVIRNNQSIERSPTHSSLPRGISSCLTPPV